MASVHEIEPTEGIDTGNETARKGFARRIGSLLGEVDIASTQPTPELSLLALADEHGRRANGTDATEDEASQVDFPMPSTSSHTK